MLFLLNNRYFFCLQNKKQLLKLSCETLKRRAQLEALLETPAVAHHVAQCAPLADDEMFRLVVAYEMCANGKIKSANRCLKQFARAAVKDVQREVRFFVVVLFSIACARVIKCLFL